jgi:hypothetical protein
MGLTIHWTLSTQRELSDAVVKELAARTKGFAEKIGCEKVLGPKRGGPGEIKLRKLPNGDTTGDLILAESGWSVMVLPGAGPEPAEFGLCRYPGSPHWKLTGACKTQYAAQHGSEHFLECHRRVIRLLDLWRDFGVDVKVLDEGEFWATRSVERLRERLGTYDRFAAGMAGALKDSLGKGPKSVQAEIFNDARFERLEAEGRAEFGAKIEEARRIIEGETLGGEKGRPGVD